MPLDFPSSPTNGQVYGSYTYSTSRGAWLNTATSTRVVTTSDTAPTNPTNGDMWMYTVDGTCFIYYNDGTSSQWVEQSKSIITPATYQSPNVLINGGFDIWQRGTSSTTNSVYLADRWIHSRSAGTHTVSQSTDVPSGIPAEYSLSFASTSGTNPQIQQRIESFNAVGLAGQTVTLSIYAKATVGTGGLSFSTGYASAVDNFTTITTDVASTALAASMSTSAGWARYSATFTVSANAINGYAINIFRNVTTTSTTTLYTGIQLELGSVATPFRRNAPSIQGELAACQRYYYRTVAGVIGGHLGVGFSVSTTAVRVPVKLPVMRTAPTAVETTGTVADYTAGGATATSISFTAAQSNTEWASLAIGVASITANIPASFQGATAAAYIGFSSEL